MFPAGASPNPALQSLSPYAVAAAAWSSVLTTQSNQVTVTRTDDPNSADVIIMGYEDPNPGATGSDGNCGDSIACTKPAGTYPHIGNGQVFLIEDPPHWGHETTAQRWTALYSDWMNQPDYYEYLPRILMHEFGHTLGLGHSAGPDIMNVATLRALTSYDRAGLRAIYQGHTPH